jgi:hypothetical protein
MLYLLHRDPGARERLQGILAVGEAEALRRLRAEFPLEHAIAYAMDEARREIRPAGKRSSCGLWSV